MQPLFEGYNASSAMYTVHINETFNTESSFLLHAVKNGVILLLCYLLPLIRVTFSHLPHM